MVRLADNVMQLQREAAQRVSRMHEQSRRIIEQQHTRTDSPIRHRQSTEFTQPIMHPSGLYARPSTPPVMPTECDELKALTSPSLSGEQWLLLGLALLLFRCDCSPVLALALVYLAL